MTRRGPTSPRRSSPRALPSLAVLFALNSRTPNGKATGYNVEWEDGPSGQLKMEIQIHILGCPTAENFLIWLHCQFSLHS